MSRHPRKTQKTRINLQELVIVTFADDLEQAKDYEALLKTNDIPTMIKEEGEINSEGIKNFAIMVPEDFLDEAHVIIESQNAYEDFYDFSSKDEDDDNFDSGFFEEKF